MDGVEISGSHAVQDCITGRLQHCRMEPHKNGRSDVLNLVCANYRALIILYEAYGRSPYQEGLDPDHVLKRHHVFFFQNNLTSGLLQS